MTYRPRPSRQALVLAAVDLAMTPELAVVPNDDARSRALDVMLEALGVPLNGPVTLGPREALARDELAEELIDAALTLDEADTQGVDGDRVRALSRPDATVAQREAELEHVRRRFDELVDAAVAALPPATIRRP